MTIGSKEVVGSALGNGYDARSFEPPLFTNYAAGQVIRTVSEATGIIAAITDNSHMTLTENSRSTTGAATYAIIASGATLAGKGLDLVLDHAIGAWRLRLVVFGTEFSTSDTTLLLWDTIADAAFDPLGANTFVNPVWQQASNLSPILDGTVSVTAEATTTVTGTGTAFTTDFAIGRSIFTAGGQERTVASITSDTLMTVSDHWATTETAVTYSAVSGGPNLAGVITVLDGKSITGNGTAFQTDFAVGNKITLPTGTGLWSIDQVREVASIQTQTQMKVTERWCTSRTDVRYKLGGACAAASSVTISPAS